MTRTYDPLQVAVVGLGRIGRLHAENLAWHVPSAHLQRVADVVDETASVTGTRLGVASSTSYEEVLSDPDVEAVVIATPTPYHAEMTEKASIAGKHVFCEKPLSHEFEPASRAVQAASAASIKLQIGFHLRFDPGLATAAERIKGGELGDIYLFRTTLRDMRPPGVDYLTGSGGIFHDGAIHNFDLARLLVGEIAEVTAFGAALSDPLFAELDDYDNAVVVVRFENGGLGVLENSRVCGYGFDCRTEVMGSRSTVRVEADRRTPLTWLTPGTATTDHVPNFVERFNTAYRHEMEAFAQSVRRDLPVRASGKDALVALALCQAALDSLKEGTSIRLHVQGHGDGEARQMV